MRHLLQYGFRQFASAVSGRSTSRRMLAVTFVAAAVGFASTPAHADVVTLKTSRTIRVISAARHGNEVALELVSGGRMVLPVAAIASVEPEPMTPELCGASPFWCQDRMLMMSRHAHVIDLTDDAATPARPDAPTKIAQ